MSAPASAILSSSRLGYARGEALLGYAEPSDERVIEYARRIKRTATTKNRGTQTPTRLSKERIAEMIEEATVDAYGESEQATGWFTMFEEHLELPFETKVLGTAVTVASIDLRNDNQIVAICTRGRDRQAISLVDLPLPSPKPAGAGWIEAYQYWLGRR